MQRLSFLADVGINPPFLVSFKSGDINSIPALDSHFIWELGISIETWFFDLRVGVSTLLRKAWGDGNRLHSWCASNLCQKRRRVTKIKSPEILPRLTILITTA
ncbi:hypothetical protein I7I48_09351 [Histoplasma ohiense]|nr:hypothetical protein I7I48_09351 [Histoplasma ohiense (nom. inval.)]